MRTEEGVKGIALTLGMISGMFSKLHELREGESPVDDRDIDSAQVYLEGAHWKLTQVLQRHQPTINPPQSDESEED